jgi:exosome complex RNA-binding protein Rrp42 (RNase PH superfamily)
MFNPISNNEKCFILENLIKNSYRESERSIEEYRKISIKKLEENGQCEVKLGHTLVISQIFAKLVSPNKERPNEGIIVFSVSTSNYLYISKKTYLNQKN